MISPQTGIAIHDRSVLIEDGTIRAVERCGELEGSGVQVLDARGMYVTPALADMHVHWWDPADWVLFVASGVATVRNMAGSPHHLDQAARIARGELPGPRLITATPVIDGTGEDGESIWPGTQLLVQPEKARPLVESYAGQGYRQIKAYGWLRPDALRALGLAAADRGLPLTGHCPEGVTFEDAMDAGMRCFEHLTGIEAGHVGDGRPLTLRRRPERSPAELRRLLAAISRIDVDGIRRLAARMAAEQVWNCPTLVLSTSALDPERALADGRAGAESQATLASWARAAGSTGPLLHSVQGARSELLRLVVSILHQEGAPLLAGTDSPNPCVFQGSSIHEELRNLTRAGLSPVAALRCATTEAARFLGESGTWGAVEPGQRADLLLTRGDPLHDLGALREPEAVLLNGFRLSRADLDRLLDQRRKGLRPPLS